jgi:hypothetical protein
VKDDWYSSRRLSQRPILRRFRRDDAEGPPFVEGLLLGIIVGAVIAGSTIWNRWRERDRGPAAPEEPRDPA